MKLRKFACMLVAAATVVASLAACGGSAPAEAPAAEAPAAEAPAAEAPAAEEAAPAEGGSDLSSVKIGAFVNVTSTDGGWSQAQYEGLTKMVADLGLDAETQFIWLEQIPEEQSSVEAAVSQLADEGCNIIFGASTGYAPILSELAPSYPEVQFVQVGAPVPNIVTYQIRDYEAMYLLGYTMGLLSDSDNMGFSAGMSEASVRRAINAYSLGVKAARENATVQVMWANSWYDIAAETECANTLINMGIKYIGVNASSPAIPQTCQEKGVFCTGYHLDIHDTAPQAVVCSYMWNWAPIMEDIVSQYAAGTLDKEATYFWGADKDCARMSEINKDIVTDDSIIAAVDEMREKIIAGEVQVYGGELKDNKGEVLVEAGQVMDDADILTQQFLVENVIGEW